MGDYNSTRSGNQYHGSDYASRMGQFDRMEAEARERAKVAERNAASLSRPTFTPVNLPNNGTTSAQTYSSSTSRTQHTRRSSVPFWICIGSAAVWFGSAIAIAELLKWLGVSSAVASKIGIWTLPALIGAAIAAVVGWVLWQLAVAIAKGLTATWRSTVAAYRWSKLHRKPLAAVALYGLCVAGVYRLTSFAAAFDSPDFDARHFKRLALSALGVALAIAVAMLWIWIASKVKARRVRAAAVSRHRIEPTYVWNVSNTRR